MLVETVGVGQAEVEIARHADTTVVVAAPGMGDAVQSSKAGILEIADILVVNKSDRDGARETARDLRDMLRLRPTAGRWLARPGAADARRDRRRCRRAGRGDGQHREHLVRSGALERQRTDRLHAVVLAYATARVRARLDRVAAGPAGRELLGKAAAGCLSPLAAAERLVDLPGPAPADPPA